MPIACRSAALAVEREVELEHVDPRLAEEAERAAVCVLLDERQHLLEREAAGTRDARRLQARVRGGDVRIEPGARGGQGIDRDPLAGTEVVLVAVRGTPLANGP